MHRRGLQLRAPAVPLSARTVEGLSGSLCSRLQRMARVVSDGSEAKGSSIQPVSHAPPTALPGRVQRTHRVSAVDPHLTGLGLRVVVVVPARRAAVVEAKRWDKPRNTVNHPDFPIAVVDQMVVEGTQKAGISHGGFAAVEPVDDVVGFGPLGRAGAVGEDTALVAGVQGTSQCRGNSSLAAANVNYFSAGAENQGDDAGVAGSFTDAFDWYCPAVRYQCGAEVVPKFLEGDGHEQLRAHAPIVWQLPRAGGVFGAINHGMKELLGPGPSVFGHRI